MTSDGLEGVTIEYNSIDLPRKVSSSGTVKANYCYLADGSLFSLELAGGEFGVADGDDVLGVELEGFLVV